MLFGAHVSSSGGIWQAIDRGEAIGCDAVQVFTQSPRMWRPTNHTPEAIVRFRERREEAGIESVVCHALYLVNLASPDPVIHGKSVAAMRASLEAAAAIGAEGVIFHVGSHLGAGFEAGLERVVPALQELLELTTDDLWLLMENSAGAGGTKASQQFDPVYVGHAEVRNQAPVLYVRCNIEEVRRTLMDANGEAGDGKKESEGIADGFLIIDNVNNGLSHALEHPPTTALERT